MLCFLAKIAMKNKKILSSRESIINYLGVGAVAFRRLMALGLPVIRLPESNQLLAYSDNLDEFIRRLTAKQNKISLADLDEESKVTR
jgi:uncharacterized protein (DUF488 family)